MIRRGLIISGYVLATALVVVGTLALVAYGNGYSYDFSTHRLVHRGLIIVDSNPPATTLMVDGKLVHQSLPYRQNFKAGWYSFSLARDGYRTWSKRIQSIPSVATVVDYVLLLPQHFRVNEIGTRPAVSQWQASADRRHIAYVVPGGPDAGLWLLDIGNQNQTKLYAAAAATDTTPAETLTIQSWAADNAHILVKSQVGDTTSLLVVSTGGGAPANITSTLSISADTLIFSPGNWRQLYWQSPDGLRRLDLGNQTISAPLATGVAGFTFAGSRVLYVDTTHPTNPQLWVMDADGGNKQKLADHLTASTSYQLDFTNYLGVPEAVVVAQTPHTAALYANILNQPGQVAPKALGASATSASFSGDGRLVVLSDSQHVATYDLQLASLAVLPAINSDVTGLNWFDNRHLVFNRNGNIVLSEYDGNYAVVITRGGSLPPFNSADGKRVYATSQTSTGTALIKAIVVQP